MILLMLDLIILGEGPVVEAAQIHATTRGLTAGRPPGPVWSVTPGFRVDSLGASPLRAIAILTIASHRDVPEWDVPRLLRASMRFDPQREAWMPLRDQTCQTSIPGLFATEDEHESARAIDSIVRVKNSSQNDGSKIEYPKNLPFLPVSSVSSQRPLCELVLLNPKTNTPPLESTICPCEGVTAAAIEAAIRDGAHDMNQLRAFTRCGMGACQGRLCEDAAARVLAPFVGGRASAGQWTMRPPLVPVPLDVLMGAYTYADIPVPPPAPL